jgi:hypothetical protein
MDNRPGATWFENAIRPTLQLCCISRQLDRHQSAASHHRDSNPLALLSGVLNKAPRLHFLRQCEVDHQGLTEAKRHQSHDMFCDSRTLPLNI